MSDATAPRSIGPNIKVLSGFAFSSTGFNQLEGMPLIRIRDLAGATTEVRFRGSFDPAYLINTGDILIGMDGDFEVHRWSGSDALLNQRVCKIEAATHEVDSGFLYWYLKPQVAAIHRRTPQTTVRHLSTKDLYVIPMPSIGAKEQASVGRILDTLDTAIHETEAVIAKLKAVKQGLLHDLLTRGIDTHGELRPPQAEAPHLYKQSPLGWIPKEWEDTNLGAVTKWASGGTPSRAVPSNWVGPVPLLTPKDMKVFEISDTSEYMSVKAAQTGSREMPAGTVFIVVRGMILAHSFPVVLCSQPMAFNQDIKAVTGGPLLSGRFLAHWFVANSNRFLRKVTEATHGTKKLDMGALVGMPIGVPSLTEQHAIIERQAAIDHRSEDESFYLAQLRALKSGLIDDLLTGRVRVTPLLESAAA